MLEKLNSSRIKSYLRTNFMGSQVIVLECIDSTQDFAERHADSLQHGSVILTEHQTHGRGRLGKVWHSTYGKAILMSIILKDSFQTEILTKFTLLASLSLAKFLESRFKLGFKVRWPNDIILGKDKIAGTLAEHRLNNLVVGIGLNVNQNLLELPAFATSIFLHTGKEENRNYLIACYLNFFEEDFYSWVKQGYDFLRKLWFSFTSLKNKKIVAKTNHKILEGVVEDLAEDCSLILRGNMGYQFELKLNELEEIKIV